MKRDFAEFAFAVVVLVCGAAAEELLPRIGPTGLPVLLMEAVFYAVLSVRTVPSVLFALAAGAVEESLSGLPPMTAVGFFLGLVALVRHVSVPRWAVALAYPAFQAWLWVWSSDWGGGVFARLLAAVPAGFLAAYAVSWLLFRLGKAVALEEA